MERLGVRANLIMEISSIVDAHTIAMTNQISEVELQSFEETNNHADKAQ